MSFILNLQLLFIALKLMDYIDWGWGMILSPLWAPILIWVLLLAFLGCFFGDDNEVNPIADSWCHIRQRLRYFLKNLGD